mmetsp:Transcript_91176/g.158039  ORF Transcript_91176/g.158039 Transcript_91176/m.158039 type:complete len:106 (+) Transcript_91176:653-970(+)
MGSGATVTSLVVSVSTGEGPLDAGLYQMEAKPAQTLLASPQCHCGKAHASQSPQLWPSGPPSPSMEPTFVPYPPRKSAIPVSPVPAAPRIPPVTPASPGRTPTTL